MTQDQVLDILKSGKNVFLTGPPGSGKTYLLNEYKKFLLENDVPVAVTATTGIAATHLSGRTIHSWSGIGIEEELTDKLKTKIHSRSYITDAVKTTSVLIIDEISMLHSYQFDMVNRICREVRGSVEPFGGLQVVCSGDFFQLPPVQRRDTRGSNWAPESMSWAEMDMNVCYLDEQFRHRDENLVKVLKDIRQDCVDESTVKLLEQRKNVQVKLDIEPAKLHTHNRSVDAINKKKLDEIGSDPHEFMMSTKGEKKLVKKLKKSCLTPEKLVLKEGAKVMFVKNNFEKGYVNGTLGRVVGFDDEGYPVVKTSDGTEVTAHPTTWSINDERGKPLASIRQIPLKLAWAVTVHKSQGMTLDGAEVDLSKSFTKGMGYVALSRIRSLDNLKLKGLNKLALQVSEKALRFDSHFKKESGRVEERFKRVDEDEIIKMQEVFLKESSKKRTGTDAPDAEFEDDEIDPDALPF